MARIKVTGYLEIEEDEADSEDPTGLTSEAFDSYFEQVSEAGLDDIKFASA